MNSFMNVSVEFYFLVASILLIISIIAGKTSYRFGVPALLLFLLVGIFAGSDGLGIQFDSPKQAQLIGVVALNIILFSGGMDTRLSEIRPILWQGIILSTFGVLLTAFITGCFIFWLTHHLFTAITFSFLESMLLGSIMSSTDSASVFSILRSKKLSIKHNLRPLLELESGSNDPIAYMLMIVFIQLLQSSRISGMEVVLLFFRQFIIGALCGYILSKMVVYFINHIQLDYEGLYSGTRYGNKFVRINQKPKRKKHNYLKQPGQSVKKSKAALFVNKSLIPNKKTTDIYSQIPVSSQNRSKTVKKK